MSSSSDRSLRGRPARRSPGSRIKGLRFASAIILLLGGAAGAAISTVSARTPAAQDRSKRGLEVSGDRLKLQQLVRRRAALRRDNELLRLEAGPARTPRAYAVLDPSRRTLTFRVRGRKMKELEIAGLIVRAPSRSGSVPPEKVFGRLHRLADRLPRDDFLAPEPVGDGSETPFAPAAGESSSDLEPTGEEAGSELATVPGIAPEPPPRFCWKFEGGLSVYVTGITPPEAPRVRRAERVIGLARILGRGLLDLLRAGSRDTELHLMMDDEQARQVFRSLLPGQDLILLTPQEAGLAG